MPFRKVLIALLVMLIFGLNAVMSKMGLQEFPPLLFTLLRFAILLPGIFFIARPQMSWGMLAAISGSISFGFLLFANMGLWLGASAGTYAFIAQTGSIFAIGVAYLILGNKPSPFDIAGIALGLVGIYWICTSNGIEGSFTALSCLVASAIMWGLGFTLVKKAHAPSVPTIVWTSIFVIPPLAVGSLLVEDWSCLKEATPVGWMSIFFSGWVSMLGAGALLMYLFRTEAVAKVAPYNMLVPVTGCLFSWLILNEQPSPNLLLGGSWILLGLIMAQVIPHLFKPAKA
ncbi:MAG: EamA family transporter [Verrucomicrobia bacterium]|nr:EamA family transporter [Verrucomicrobiota bacterium]MBS0636826.1 EamA family transporter [Verrucomicrobiota bacterium]